MNEIYGDGSDHEVCETCGLCITCGDCEKYGCKNGKKKEIKIVKCNICKQETKEPKSYLIRYKHFYLCHNCWCELLSKLYKEKKR